MDNSTTPVRHIPTYAFTAPVKHVPSHAEWATKHSRLYYRIMSSEGVTAPTPKWTVIAIGDQQ